ncbi:hypothetical protein [Micromonospora sp. NPDC049497]|uniref:hypothetical protein n=1 Tax=Micromonospora sp. NPDC049497 TaxID=3364273 RepID=UPI00378DF898
MGAFDVADRPKSSTRFDREIGYRTIPESGVPVCVHPDRIGVPPGEYASNGTAPPHVPYLRRLWLRIRVAASSSTRSR